MSLSKKRLRSNERTHETPRNLLSGWKTTLPIKRLEATELSAIFDPEMQLIGTGTFGKLYRATLKIPIAELRAGTAVALKEQNLDAFSDRIESLRSEIEILQKAKDCPNVNKLYDVLFDSSTNKLYFVLEYLRGMDLFDQMQEWPDSSEARLLPIVSGLIKGLKCLHARGIAHRDVKLENVMIVGGSVPEWIDFGGSCVAENCTTGLEGTVTTMAPEVIAQSIATVDEWKRSDLWSFGVLLYMLCMNDYLPLQDKLIQMSVDKQTGNQTQAGLERVRDWISASIATTDATDLLLRDFDKNKYPQIHQMLQILLDVDPIRRERNWIKVQK